MCVSMAQPWPTLLLLIDKFIQPLLTKHLTVLHKNLPQLLHKFHTKFPMRSGS